MRDVRLRSMHFSHSSRAFSVFTALPAARSSRPSPSPHRHHHRPGRRSTRVDEDVESAQLLHARIDRGLGALRAAHVDRYGGSVDAQLAALGHDLLQFLFIADDGGGEDDATDIPNTSSSGV